MSVSTDPDVVEGAPAPDADVAAAARAVARRQGIFLLGGNARLVLLGVLTVLMAVLLIRPPSTGSGQDFATTASSINVGLRSQTGVTASSAGYLPGTGIVVVSSVANVASTQLNGVLASAMGPFVAQIAALPSGEALSWQTTLTSSDGVVSTWLIRVGAGDVENQSKWVAVPVAAGAAGAAAGAAGAAAGAAAAATTVAGSAAPATTTGAVVAAESGASSGSAAAAAPTTAVSAAAAPSSAAAAGTAGTAGTAGSDAATTAAGASKMSDDFSGDATLWTPLTGTWSIKDGSYQQADAGGYDYISQFNSTLPAAYSVSVSMKGLADTVNGGLIIGQPDAGSRKGATIIDLTSKDYVRWGKYDAASGTYTFIGGAALGAEQAAATAHILKVDVAATGTTVNWDGKRVGSFSAVTGSYAGLVTSQSAVSFDDFAVTAS